MTHDKVVLGLVATVFAKLDDLVLCTTEISYRQH